MDKRCHNCSFFEARAHTRNDLQYEGVCFAMPPNAENKRPSVQKSDYCGYWTPEQATRHPNPASFRPRPLS